MEELVCARIHWAVVQATILGLCMHFVIAIRVA